MREDEDLDRAVVYHNLAWSWSFYGLRLYHFAASGGLSMVVLLFAVLFGFNMLYGIAFFLAANVGLAILQWRKPQDYLPDLINYVVLPRHLTCLEDDDITYPFPVSREEALR